MRGYIVEMSFLTPIIMLLVMSSIYAFFYYHDKNIIAGAAYETAIVGSNKAREKSGSQTRTGDKSGTDAAELETLFQSCVNGSVSYYLQSRDRLRWKKMKSVSGHREHGGR